MFNLYVKREIACSHQLMEHKGKCRNLHGHNFIVEVNVQGEWLIPQGSSKNMLVDFGDIKEIIDFYDHKHLNDVTQLTQPTAEMMAQNIASKIILIENADIVAIEVKIWETQNQCVSFTYDKRRGDELCIK